VKRKTRALVIIGFTLLSLLVIVATALAAVFHRASVLEERQNKEIRKQKQDAEAQLARNQQLLSDLNRARAEKEQIVEETVDLINRKESLVRANAQLQRVLEDKQRKAEEAERSSLVAMEVAAVAGRRLGEVERKITEVESDASAARLDATRWRQRVERLENSVQAIPLPPVPGESPEPPAAVSPMAVTRIQGNVEFRVTPGAGWIPPVVHAKLCINKSGVVTQVDLLTELERPARTELTKMFEDWTYQPYRWHGVAVPVCFTVTLKVKI
jgi:hypothetical protein